MKGALERKESIQEVEVGHRKIGRCVKGRICEEIQCSIPMAQGTTNWPVEKIMCRLCVLR